MSRFVTSNIIGATMRQLGSIAVKITPQIEDAIPQVHRAPAS